jgi:hypothetical protein
MSCRKESKGVAPRIKIFGNIISRRVLHRYVFRYRAIYLVSLGEPVMELGSLDNLVG